jgi:hypothetical protein
VAFFLCGRCGEDVTRRVADAFASADPPGERVIVVCSKGHRSAFVESPTVPEDPPDPPED